MSQNSENSLILKILIQTKSLTFCLLFALFLIVAGCNSSATKDQKPEIIKLTDDLGRELKLAKQPKRVMGLAPSITEMLAVLVPDSQIIGRTEHCNYPAWVKNKPVVGTYPLDVEALLKLKPDLVITVEGMTSLENAQKLEQVGIPVYYQRYNTVNEIFTGLLDLGNILGHTSRAEQVVDSLKLELAKIQASATKNQPSQTVIALAWQDPIMVYGYNNIFTDKIRLAGGRNSIDTTLVQPFPTITREHLLKLNPDVIISRSFQEMDTSFFRLYPELKALNAYKTKRIFGVDADLMERPTPRVIQSVQELKALLK